MRGDLPPEVTGGRSQKHRIADGLQELSKAKHALETVRRRKSGQVIGTLGILAKARATGLIASFAHALLNMREQGIFFSEALVYRIAAKLGETKLH